MAGSPPTSVTAYRIEEDDFVLFVWDSADAAKEASEPLSLAEREVLEMVERGLSNAAIATARGTSIRTVANQVASLLKKLNLGSRFEIIARTRSRTHDAPATTSRGVSPSGAPLSLPPRRRRGS